MPQDNSNIAVGVIGAGWVATDRHVPAYLRSDSVRVAGVADRKLNSARVLAGKAKAPLATTDIDELLDLPLDAVSICTPPFSHRELAIKAMESGTHVFLEKPMAMSLSEAEEMAAASRATGRMLCVSHNFLFSRSMQRIRKALASGEAGEVEMVVAFQASSPQRRLPTWYGKLPGGLFFDESPHLLYLLAGILGETELVHAHATGDSSHAEQPIRTLQATIRSASAPASLIMSFDAPVSEWHLLIVCKNRVLIADLFRDVSTVLGPDRRHEALDILRTSAFAGIQQAAGFVHSGLRVAAGRQHWGHETLIHNFIDSVRTGGDAPVPIEDALNVCAITDDILGAIG